MIIKAALVFFFVWSCLFVGTPGEGEDGEDGEEGEGQEKERREGGARERVVIVAMARVGEGDPRWLVAERTDGRNVNGWHWEEKNALSWSKKRIQELLKETGSSKKEGEEDADVPRGEQRYCIRAEVDEPVTNAQRIGITGLKTATGDVR